MESSSLRSGSAGSRTPSARRSLTITFALAFTVALAAVGTASGRPEGSLGVALGKTENVSQGTASAKGAVSVSAFGADVRFSTPVPVPVRSAGCVFSCSAEAPTNVPCDARLGLPCPAHRVPRRRCPGGHHTSTGLWGP